MLTIIVIACKDGFKAPKTTALQYQNYNSQNLELLLEAFKKSHKILRKK